MLKCNPVITPAETDPIMEKGKKEELVSLLLDHSSICVRNLGL